MAPSPNAWFTADCMYVGHGPFPASDMETTFAGNGFDFTPLIQPPAAHTIASVTSEANPVPQRPRTLRIDSLAYGATALTTDATFVPCHVGVGHAGPWSPGSVKSGLRPSFVLLNSEDDMKQNPPTGPHRSIAEVARPESRSATTEAFFFVSAGSRCSP